ncbi:MAG: AAA family ATPase [Candidatus Didemnitutus sp.]|nr:AAA family ATPase [Candidatus Didemnitutus sp.]
MIASVHFKNFKALRSATVKLEPFNLVIGPNGSGKTSLIQALLRLRTLAALPAAHTHELKNPRVGGPEIEFRFLPPFDGLRVVSACAQDELVCDTLVVHHPPGDPGEELWTRLRARLLTMRGFLFDHYAMAVPAKRDEGRELASNAGNLAAVLADWRQHTPETLEQLEAEFHRIVPEFKGLEFRHPDAASVELLARVNGDAVPADSLSQGTLYLLAVLALAFAPEPPAVVCLEEADRGVHPRMLREIRDALYRLSYPRDCGVTRAPVQVITTTHSPYLLDLFKDHPDEVVLANKHGRSATFERLSARADLRELLSESNLGDLWYSGILGGTPDEA